MRNITKFVEDLVNDRNEIIARLAFAQNVDLTLSDYSNFKPDPKLQKQSLADLTDLAIDLWSEYKNFKLPEILQYCKEVGKFKEEWSGIWKDDALKLLGLEANSDIELLFDGRVHLFENIEESANDSGKLSEMLEQLI